jgi:hypothetical protein
VSATGAGTVSAAVRNASALSQSNSLGRIRSRVGVRRPLMSKQVTRFQKGHVAHTAQTRLPPEMVDTIVNLGLCYRVKHFIAAWTRHGGLGIMHEPGVSEQRAPRCEALSAFRAGLWPVVVMNRTAVLLEVARGAKPLVALRARKCFDSLVHNSLMQSKMTGLAERATTAVAIKRLDVLMHGTYVLPQSAGKRKPPNTQLAGLRIQRISSQWDTEQCKNNTRSCSKAEGKAVPVRSGFVVRLAIPLT